MWPTFDKFSFHFTYMLLISTR